MLQAVGALALCGGTLSAVDAIYPFHASSRVHSPSSSAQVCIDRTALSIPFLSWIIMYRRVPTNRQRVLSVCCIQPLTVRTVISEHETNVVQVRRSLPTDITFDEVWNIFRTDEEINSLRNRLVMTGGGFASLPELPPILDSSSINRFFGSILREDPTTGAHPFIDEFFMISSIPDALVYGWIRQAVEQLPVWTPSAADNLIDPTLLRERVGNCLKHAMNIVLSEAWETPVRLIIERAITYPEGYGFVRRNRIILGEVLNGRRGHWIIKSLLSWVPDWMRVGVAPFTEVSPVVSRPEALLIIRRFLASIEIILSVDYMGAGSGSSKVDFKRAPLEQFPSVALCKISVTADYCGYLFRRRINEIDLHCVESVVEITMAHELIHIATAYLFGEKRTSSEFPFVYHGENPHSSFYCESRGNKGFIGLYKHSAQGRLVGVGMESTDRSEKLGVSDEWVNAYVSARDDPNRLTETTMNLEAQSLRNVFRDDAWIVDDKDKDDRQCLRRKRDGTRYRAATSESPLIQRRLTYQVEDNEDLQTK